MLRFGMLRLALLLAGLSWTLPASAQTADTARLPDPLFPQATALYEQGRFPEALATLDAVAGDGNDAERSGSLEAILLRAAVLLAAGRPLESVQLWREAGRADAAVAGLARRMQVLGFVRAGRLPAARGVLGEILDAGGGGSHLDLIVTVADALREQGEGTDAAALYQQVLRLQLEGRQSDAARLGLAALREAAGDLEGAVAMLRQAQLRHREPMTYITASARERGLAMRLGGSPEAFTEDEYLALSRRLSRASWFAAAITVLNEWKHRHPATARGDEIEGDLIENLYDQRANDQARGRIELFKQEFPASPRLPRVHLTEFRLDAREGRTGDTVRKGYALWRGDVAGTTPALRYSAGLLLGAYLVSIGRAQEGLRVFDGLVESMEPGDERVNLQWRAAIAALRAGLDAQALERLRALHRLGPGGETAPAVLYWLGEAEERAGDARAAIRAWVTLEQRYTHHYYGRRAHDRLEARLARPELQPLVTELRQAGAIAPPRFPAPRLTPAARELAEYRAAARLAGAGLRSEALDHARQALARARGDHGLALLTARAAVAAGDYRYALALLAAYFGQFLEQRGTELPDDFWDLAYPRPFLHVVQEAALGHDVDPLLLFALMRQESAFDPGARSNVGAIGLFQIMPATAAELVREDLPVPDEDVLRQPAVNASLAAALVARLRQQFGRALAPAIASYNAGAERVSAWWEAAEGLPEDLFIDSIPYTETRRFVRAVLNNYLAYRSLTDLAAGER